MMKFMKYKADSDGQEDLSVIDERHKVTSQKRARNEPGWQKRGRNEIVGDGQAGLSVLYSIMFEGETENCFERLCRKAY